MKHLHFWGGESESAQFEQFLQRYDTLLLSRGAVDCAKCNGSIPPQNESWFDRYSASQKYTCYECQKNYCENCEDDDGDYILKYCGNCERQLCSKCQEKEFCSSCRDYICVDCEKVQCSNLGHSFWCDKLICKDCFTEGGRGWKICHGKCKRLFCRDCNSMHLCGDCCEEYCDDCDNYDDSMQLCRGCDRSICNKCNMKESFDALYSCGICGECHCGECLAKICRDDTYARLIAQDVSKGLDIYYFWS